MSAGMDKTAAWDDIPFEDRVAALRGAVRLFDGAGVYARMVAAGERPDGPPGAWIWGEPPQGWRDILEGADALRVRELAGNPFELQDGNGGPSGPSPRRPLALSTAALYLGFLRELMEDAEAAGGTIPAEVRERAEVLAGECRFGFGQAMEGLRAEYEIEGATLAGVRRIAEARQAMHLALGEAEAAREEAERAKQAERKERENRIAAEAEARTWERVANGELAGLRGEVGELTKEARAAFFRGENELERALTSPADMAAEILKLAQGEMSAKGAVLWGAYVKHGYSLHAASKALGKGFGWGTAYRLFQAEVLPFMVKHGLTVKKKGRHAMLAYDERTDGHLSRPSGYHGPHKLDDDGEDEDGDGGD